MSRTRIDPSLLNSLSSNLNLGSNKITNLANGTAATDAAAFGQIKVLQIVGFEDSTEHDTTSSTFNATSTAVTITPTSASNRILIIATGSMELNASNISGMGTLARGTTTLHSAGTTGFWRTVGGTATGNISADTGAMVYIDSPATTSATTYSVYVRSPNNSSTVAWNGGGAHSYIVAIEIV